MMFQKFKILLIVVLTALSSFTFLFLADWEIGKGYVIKFDGKYAHGTFSDLSGLIHFDPQSPGTAKFNVSVKVSSIETGNDLKNKHAKSDKWFDAEQFPVVHFTSSEVTKTNSGYIVKGVLDLRGIKKELEIPFTFKQEETGSQFDGKFKINRGDFGIGKTNGRDSDSTTVEVSVPVISLK